MVGGPGVRHAVVSLGGYLAQQPVEAVALRVPDGSQLTYGALTWVLGELAETLRSLGIGRNHRVGVALGHGIENAVCVVGIADYCALVPLHPDATAQEAVALFADASLAAVVVAPDASPGIREAASATRVGLIEMDAVADAARGTVALRPLSPVKPPSAPQARQDVALILSTSGSTARSKLVPHTAASLLAGARYWAGFHQLGPADHTVLCLPLFHSFGLTGCLAPALVSGGSVTCVETLEPVTLLDELERGQATWMSCTPTMLQGVVRHLEAGARPTALPSLNFIRTGTAALTEDTRLRAERLLDTAVLASYGLSETGSVAANPGPPRVRKPGTVGIAYAAEVAVVDGEFAPCEVGVVGEVVVSGDTVTSGYLNAPEENEQLFVGTWLRTGDQGFLDADGFLTLVGRTKHMINRGGQSISPLELEQAIATHGSVVEVAVVGVPHESLGEEVAAAVVWRQGQSPAPQQLREFLASRLVEYKIPSRWLDVDELPRSPVGKVRIQALIDLFTAKTGGSDAAELPRIGIEAEIAKAWEEVLGRTGVKRSDAFISSGGDSLTAVALAARLRDCLEVEVDEAMVLGASSLEELSVQASRAPALGERISLQPVISAQSPSSGVLSFAEQALWLEEKLIPGTSRYHETMLLSLQGSVDQHAFGHAVEELCVRHEALRTGFPTVGGEPVRVAAGEAVADHLYEDCSNWGADEIERHISDLVELRFDIGSGPLWRSRLLCIAPDEHLLVWTVHHIVNDKRSSQIMLADLMALYGGGAPSLAPIGPVPSVYAAWQRERMSEEAISAATRFWTKQLEDAMPLDHPHASPAASRDRRVQRIDQAGDRELAQAVRRCCSKVGVTPFVLLQLALKVALGETWGTNDVSIGTSVDVRPPGELENVVGCFVNTIILRTHLAQTQTFDDLVQAERSACFAAYANRDVPFELVVDQLRATNATSPIRLADVMFSLDESQHPTLFAPGVQSTRLPVHPRSAKIDLSVDVFLTPDDGLRLTATYRQARFSGDDVSLVLNRMDAWLRRNIC